MGIFSLICVLVSQRGADLFKVMVTDSTGYELPREDIFAALKHISDTEPSQSTPIGVLTTMPRDEWASARARMISSPVNAASLADIDSALFVVGLDPEVPASEAVLNRIMLHGDGRSRWYVDYSACTDTRVPSSVGNFCLSLEIKW